MRIRRLVQWFAAGLVALVAGGSAVADGATISGTVLYRERIMLPETAVVTVQLLDVSLADAPAKVLGETVASGKSPPYAYSIDYDPDAIVPGRRYSVSARITEGDTLLFISTTHNGVFGDGPDATEILVQRVAEAPAAETAAEGPVGRWLAEDVDGGGVIDNLQSVIEIAADGQVGGTGGCNRIGGQAVIEGTSISFGSMFSTEMACAPAVMDQEGKFLDALGRVASFRRDEARGKLILLDAAGKEIITLAQHDGP